MGLNSQVFGQTGNQTIKTLHQSEAGLTTIEWVLMIGGVIVPIMVFILKLAIWIGQYFSFTSWVMTLPFL